MKHPGLHSRLLIFISFLLLSYIVSGQGIFTVTATAVPDEICQGESVQLDVIVEGGSGSYAYLWTSIPAGFNTSLKNPVVKPDTSTYYIIKASDGPNTGYDTILVVVNENPRPTIGGDTMICIGENIIYDPGPGFITYEWQDGSTEQTYTGSKEGLYWVEVTNSFGCHGRDSAFLDILEPPSKPAKPAGPSFMDLFLNNTSSYTTSTGLIDDYEWDLNPDFAGQIQDSGQMAIIEWDTTFAGEATISVRAQNTCGYSDWSDSLRINIINSTGMAENKMIRNIIVFPNPFTDETSLLLDPVHDMSFKLVIHDLKGKEVFRADQLLAKDHVEIKLKLGHIPAGIYTLKIIYNQGQISRKLIRID